ncbi:hypothetical protein WR25_26357 [Diploscapter pachys]|uniref:Uncharacterized protein n=1 Tax=Diploscapter pachys TaxID=2018661 RepID=A0A2A2JJF3_9BILA|nr:hypothetical protein WR25_26357 [Diploscapter pachys]
MADKEYDSAIPFQLQLRIVSTAVDEEDEARPAVKPVRLSCFDGWRQRIGKCDVGKAAAGLRQRLRMCEWLIQRDLMANGMMKCGDALVQDKHS